MRNRKNNNAMVVDLSNRNAVAKQFTPLVYKIAGQMHKSMGYDMNECISAGFEGLLYAMDTYKNDKDQTFTQYGAYMIRFSIMNDFNKNGRTIRVSWDQQKKANEVGEDVNLCKSLDSAKRSDEDGMNMWERKIKGDDENDVLLTMAPAEGDMWNEIWEDIKDMFNERDKRIFFATFGVGGVKEVSGKDLAKEMGISPAAITQSRNKIIRKIKANKKLMEKLVEVMCVMNRENYA